MSGEIIIPPQYTELSGSVIFLAGPIQGAPDWQSEAINCIKRKNPEVHIASPRRSISRGRDFSQEDYNEQVDWEHFYLQRAGDDGVILFWLAREVKHSCERAYAQTSRFELGETSAIHRFLGIKVVVGIEDGFSNARYIRRTLLKKYPNIPICSSLEEVCEAVIQLAGR